MIAEGAPGDLKRSVGGDVIVVQTRSPEQAAETLKRDLEVDCEVLDDQIRVTSERGEDLVANVYKCVGNLSESVSVGKPTLEDVFVAHSGRQFHTGGSDDA